MRHFFSVYKNLEGKETVVNEEQGPDEAKRIIQNCPCIHRKFAGNGGKEAVK